VRIALVRVAVYCASSESIDPVHIALASEVGAALAARGWDLVSGGGRVSMMGAVAAAVRAGGRHTVGVIPQGLMAREDADVDADELLVVADMRARKAEMEARADAFLALPGGIGTLEELFEVWTARSLALHHKPVVICDPTGTYAPLRSALAGLAAAGFVRQLALDTLEWTDTVNAALEACARGTIVP
jgi:uncharacterized protein (TIGR00730 family)